MNKEEFFDKCAQILNTEHNYVEIKLIKKIDQITGLMVETNSRSTRWGPRIPGNGRYPGYGVISVFSASQILVNLNNPKSVSKTFGSYEEVIEFLKTLVDNKLDNVNIKHGG